jgi:hypothetical protein
MVAAMNDTDRLAALLHNFSPALCRHGETAECDERATALIAAGVTLTSTPAPLEYGGTATEAVAFIRARMAEDPMVTWPGEIDDILEGVDAIYGPTVQATVQDGSTVAQQATTPAPLDEKKMTYEEWSAAESARWEERMRNGQPVHVHDGEWCAECVAHGAATPAPLDVRCHCGHLNASCDRPDADFSTRIYKENRGE